MKYEEALAQVKSDKPKGNMMLIKMDYHSTLVLPYQDGLTFMGALANAEMLEEPWDKVASILPLDRSKIEVRLLSRQEYEDFKVAMLLGVKKDELVNYRNGNEPSTN